MRRVNVLVVVLTLFVASVALAQERNVPEERSGIRAATISAIVAVRQPGAEAPRPVNVRPAGSTCDLAPSGECWDGDQTEGDPSGWGGGSVPRECDTRVVDYVSCKSKCLCIYNYNMKRCDGDWCRRTAEADLRACNTQCEIDFVSW